MKKPVWKKILKISLAVLASVAAFGLLLVAVLLYFVFTPSRITPVVEKVAGGCLDAEVRAGRIELVFFSTFPRFTVMVDDGALLSGSPEDTLLAFSRCGITVEPMAYIKDRRIVVRRMYLDSLRLNACRHEDGTVNWNILPDGGKPADTSVSDTQGGFSPDAVVIRRLRVENADVVFDDRQSGLYVRARDAGTGLRFGAGKRGVAAGLDLSAGDVFVRQNDDVLADGVSVELETAVGINRDSLKAVLRNASLEINGIRLSLDGVMRRDTVSGLADVDMAFSAEAPSVEKVLELIPESLVERRGISAEGSVSLEGTVKGSYGNGALPAVGLCFRINDASARYEGLPYGIDYLSADFDAFIDLMRKGNSYADLKIFKLQGNDMDVLADARITELFEDPLISLNAKLKVDMGSVAGTFPLREGIDISGRLDADVKIKTRLSAVRNQDYGRIFAAGRLDMDSLRVCDTVSGLNAGCDAGLRFFGGKALGMEGNINSLDLRSKRINAVADTLSLKVVSSRPRDTTRVFGMKADFTMNRVGASVGDSLKIYCGKGNAVASLGPGTEDPEKPCLDIKVEADSVFAKAGETAGGMKKAVIKVRADKKRDSLWVPSGTVRFNRLVLDVPQCALPLRFNRTAIGFGNGKVTLKKAAIRVGRSNVVLSGNVYDLYGALKHGKMLKADLDVSSRNINVNQLMRAMSLPDAPEQEIEADTASSAMRLFEVPDNIDFDLTTDIAKLRFGKYVFRNIKGRAELKDSHVYLENLSLDALDSASLKASLIYKAASSRFGYAGFDIKVKDVDIASLVDATPAIDSLVPMLQSFKGKVQVDVAAEAVLDSALNIRIPSLRSAVYIRGDSLVLMDGETFAEISKKLMFRNKKENMIDSISVNITVEDGSVNIYPFLVEIDRYKAAVGGVQNLDMSFDYHISILKSPLPFKAGLNIRGTLDDMRFGIGRAKYKNAVTPVETRRIDSLRINLSDEITRRFRRAGERGRWGERAAARAGIDWDRKRDSVRRNHRITFEDDSVQWERMPARVSSDEADSMTRRKF